ncbi:uncharacterized protein LOC131543396, partial [Onychostoma macrolepis]|uniref:uncharacterized protein LOC131543396 n=1 Tax=Onychostoma macrolepis TaxID=369639 RepID=UPI00272CC8BA
MEQPGPSSGAHSSSISGPATEEWKTVENPQEDVQLFFEHLREGGKRQPTLFLSLDSRDTDEERDRSLISFYKQQREKNQWAAPFNCHIQGDAAIGIGVTRHILSTTIAKLKHGFKLNYGNAAETTLFEGEIDHLLPTASAVLVESELFEMAGRMIGHSLINQGPALSGLSLAIVHSLTGGTKDTATTNLCLEDCPDIEQRETIRLLLKDEWTEDETSQVSNLCLDFYFAVPNKRSNKILLFQQLLTHAVLGRAGAQLKQLKKGLKDTGVWPLISCRPDVLPLLFPRESEVEITPEMILQAIQWPQTQHTEDSDADDIQPEKLNLVTGLLRTFVEHDDPTVAARIAACLNDISKWMKDHHLQVNLAKTELLVVSANPSLHHNFSIQLVLAAKRRKVDATVVSLVKEMMEKEELDRRQSQEQMQSLIDILKEQAQREAEERERLLIQEAEAQ